MKGGKSERKWRQGFWSEVFLSPQLPVLFRFLETWKHLETSKWQSMNAWMDALAVWWGLCSSQSSTLFFPIRLCALKFCCQYSQVHVLDIVSALCGKGSERQSNGFCRPVCDVKVHSIGCESALYLVWIGEKPSQTGNLITFHAGKRIQVGPWKNV